MTCFHRAKAYPGIVDLVNSRSDGSVFYGITFEDGEVRESVVRKRNRTFKRNSTVLLNS